MILGNCKTYDKALSIFDIEITFMHTPKNDGVIKNNHESRTGLERRQFSYTAYIPERRSGKDRRKGSERRNNISRLRRSESRGTGSEVDEG